MATINPNAVLKSDFHSMQPPLVIFDSGTLTLNASSSTISHNLGYVPLIRVWAYQKSSTELGMYQQISTFLIWHYGFLSTPDVTWYADENDVVFTNSINGPITIVYRIYYND